MKSIRLHLLYWLLPGFLILWLVAGSSVYLSVKQRYDAELDANLRELWAALPFGDRTGRASLLSIEDFAKDDFGIFFEVWDQTGNRFLKSENLGRFDLPMVGTFFEEPVYGDAEIFSGEEVRTLSVQESGGSLGPVQIVVAKSKDAANASLRKVLIAILGIGAATGILFTSLLTLALRSGMRPLSSVGRKAEEIGVETLSDRFPVNELPAELHPIVEKLNDLMSRLEGSFVREKRFAGDLAHELRTPVAALRSIAEVALRWPEQASDENYEDVLEISGNLQVTIENLLTLARLEKGRAEISKEEVNLRAIVSECWEPFQLKAEERNLRFEMEIEESKRLLTDPKLIRLILSNLLSNAADYTPEGAAIVVTADDPESILCVSNPAPHLKESDIPLLFDRLWRHDEARTDSSHSGLGLSLARTCAEVLELSLSAGLEKGSLTFCLKLSEK